MKLWLNEYDKNGVRKYLDVSFWSMMKSYILCWLAIVGIVYATIIILVIVLAILGLMIGATL